MAFALNGLLVGLRAGLIVVGAVGGLILGLMAVCAVIAILSQIIALFVGEPRQEDAEKKSEAE